ncbi:MAG: murein biosynthesis integral membrane protein MurJ [bacterium]|nr:MAG: murein biosynthesis integral membrane protein MurJ [bacterium]
MTERKGIIRAAGVVGGATVLSRVLGLVRDAVMAFLFGATPAADAFFVAFRIPNLMRQLFGEGALASSFVPVYTDVLEHGGEEEARRLTDGLFTMVLLLLAAISLAGILLAPLVVRCIAFGFEPGSDIFHLTVLLTRWMFPYTLLICVAALGMGLLNANRHFLIPALAPALLNICIIGFALGISPKVERPILALAWGVLVGGVLQVLIQWYPLRQRRVLPRLTASLISPGTKRVLVMMVPAALGVAVYQVNMLVDTLLASFLPRGSITYLWYGNRMVQFPLGVFGIALATAALPTLSRQFSEGRREDFTGTVSFALSLTAFIGLPAALGLMVLKEPIMATLFARGAFGGAEVDGAAKAMMFYSLGLPFFIGVKIFGRAFYAMENTRIPFAAATASMVTNVILNLLLMGPLLHGGLALATSLSSFLNFAILAVAFTGRTGTPWLSAEMMKDAGKSLLSALIMSAVVLFAATRMSWLETGTGSRIAGLVGCMALGIIVYSGSALVMGSSGAAAVRDRFSGREKLK